MKRTITILSFVFLLFASEARSQSLYGDFVKPPTDIQRGFFIGAESGMSFFLDSGGTVENPGYSIAFFSGADIIKYLAAMAKIGITLNSAAREYEQLQGGMYSFTANGLLRGFYPLGRIYPFIDFGGGLFFTHPEYVAGIGKKWDLEFGFGVEYFTYQRQ